MIIYINILIIIIIADFLSKVICWFNFLFQSKKRKKIPETGKDKKAKRAGSAANSSLKQLSLSHFLSTSKPSAV